MKTRCSPKAIAKIMKELREKDELMKAIEDMGFGSLKHLHGVKLEHQYIRELVNSFHVQSSSVCGVVVTDKDVGDILGVKSSGKLIPNISNDDLAKFQDKYKKKNITTLTKALKEFEHADLNFREQFFLCTFSNFYCPIVKDTPGRRLYDALPVLTSPQEYNWGKFILDFLVEEIGNYKLRAQGKDASSLRNLGVGGCTYFLQVFYLQRISPLPVERGKPVMSAWTTEETRKAKEMTEKAKKKTEKAKGPKNIINNDDGNKEQFVKDFPGCSSLEQRMARVEQLLKVFPVCSSLEQRMARVEQLLGLPGCTIPRVEQLLGLPGCTIPRPKIFEEIHSTPRKVRSTDEDPMLIAVKNSFKANSLVSTDVLFLYTRHLNRTKPLVGGVKFFLNDAYTYQLMEAEYDRSAPMATLANKLKFNEYSYLLLPVCVDYHYSLVIVCFGDEEENSSPILLHLDSFSFHTSTSIFKKVKWFLEKLWINTKGSNSNMPNVIEHQVKVPQQQNSNDCAFFVMHMMDLFIDQAPMRFRTENLEMFSNWFDPKDASALREGLRDLIHEELENYYNKQILWNNDIPKSSPLQQTDDIPKSSPLQQTNDIPESLPAPTPPAATNASAQTPPAATNASAQTPPAPKKIITPESSPLQQTDDIPKSSPLQQTNDYSSPQTLHSAANDIHKSPLQPNDASAQTPPAATNASAQTPPAATNASAQTPPAATNALKNVCSRKCKKDKEVESPSKRPRSEVNVPNTPQLDENLNLNVNVPKLRSSIRTVGGHWRSRKDVNYNKFWARH